MPWAGLLNSFYLFKSYWFIFSHVYDVYLCVRWLELQLVMGAGN